MGKENWNNRLLLRGRPMCAASKYGERCDQRRHEPPNDMKSTTTTQTARGSRSLNRIVRERRESSLADIIQSEVGYFNGWSVSQEDEREACKVAASKILARIARWKLPNACLSHGDSSATPTPEKS